MSNKKNAKPAKVKKAETAKQPTDAQGLRELIAAKEKKLGTLSSWQPAYDVVKAEILKLQQALELAELRELPAPAEVTTQFQERDIAISTIVDTGNHREEEDQAAVERLANSLKTQGLQQRIGVRDMGDGRFERIFGSRRTAAAKLAGWTEIPAKVYSRDLTAAQVEILRSIENLGRKQLTPVEQAMAIARTIDACNETLSAPDKLAGDRPKRARGEEDSRYQLRLQAWEDGLRQAQDAALSLQRAIDAAGGMEAYVGQQYSRPAKWVKDHAYVSRIGGAARALLMAGRLDVAQARELAKLGDKQLTDDIAEEAARDEHGLGGKDVQYVRMRVNASLRPLGRQPWKLDIAFGHNVAGCTGQACMTCPFNSKTDPDLFGGSITDEPEAGFCTNEACFEAKGQIIERRLVAITKESRPIVKKQKSATETVLAPVLLRNSIVKPSSAVRRVQKDLADLLKPTDSVKPSTATGAGSAAAASKPGKLTPEEIAQQKLDVAMGKWAQNVCDAMKTKADEDESGVRILGLLALEYLGLDRLHRSWEHGPLPAHELDLLKKVAKQDMPILMLGTLTDALKKADVWHNNVFDTLMDRDEALDVYNDAWGLNVPKPTLDQFLPTPKQPKTEKTKPEKASKLAKEIVDEADQQLADVKAATETTADGDGETFDEETPILDPEAHKLDVEHLERADCSAVLKTAGVDGAPDVPEITPITFDGKDWACVGLVTLRGRECWKLVELAKTGAKPAPFTNRGKDTADRAIKGLFDGAVVKVAGAGWRVLLEDPAKPGQAHGAVFFENAAAMAGAGA